MTLDLNLYNEFYLNNEIREFVSCVTPTCLGLAYLWYDLKKEQWRKITGRERHINLKNEFEKIGLGDLFYDEFRDDEDDRD